jgi:hypothetical protein
MVGVVFFLTGKLSGPVLSYRTHKALHLLGVILFLGSMTVSPLWVVLLTRSKDPAALPAAARGLALSDLLFTHPGAQLTLWNGLWLGQSLGGAAAYAWLREAAWLVLGTLGLSVTLVSYWQDSFSRSAMKRDLPGAERALIHWSIWGTILALPLSAVYWLMLTKRSLWSADS